MRKSHCVLLVSTFALVLGTAVPLGMSFAASSGSSSSSKSTTTTTTPTTTTQTNQTSEYLKAKAMVDAKNYRGAMPILEKIVAKDPRNADALNLMGFSSRKLGKPDDAMEYYQKALAINPNHVGANEYLGEFYLEMKNLPKAEERLKVLAKACKGCEEQKDLEAAIAKYKASSS
jgi:tetratricopeptide (TPR) repeat protein